MDQYKLESSEQNVLDALYNIVGGKPLTGNKLQIVSILLLSKAIKSKGD